MYRQLMHGRVRQHRLPSRRGRVIGTRGNAPQVISGADVVLVGFFSAKQKDYNKQMDDAAGRVASLGGHVVARFVQRRGVSDGGVAVMSRPFSRRTVVSRGKASEIAVACNECDAAAVVFLNPLSPHQEDVLSGVFGRPVGSISTPGTPGPGKPASPPELPAEPRNAH